MCFFSNPGLISLHIFQQCIIVLHPGLQYKIPVFSDPAPGKSYATTYEQMGS